MTSSEPLDPVLGQRIADRYRVSDLIARGGMARVYRSRDERLDRDVALKVLSRPYADDATHVERFLGEARTAASLSHPNLVHVYDSGTDGALHFIVMELLTRYRPLRALVAERGRLPPVEVLQIGQDLLAGLELVHERGLVHCDVKSANVMLGPGPTKLIDFGIARTPESESGGDTSIGSLHYMAPEQLHGEALSPASDLYGVGVVLYEALTGQIPFEGRTPTEVADAQRRGQPVAPGERVSGVPQQLDRVVLQALTINPSQRFTSAAAMRRALDSVEPDDVPRSDVPQGDEDETTSFQRPASEPGRAYLPPPIGTVPASRDRPRAGRAAARRANRGSWVATLVLVAVAAGVVWLVFALGSGGLRLGGDPSDAPQPSSAPGSGLVTVPDTVGLTFDAGIEAARQAGLDWTVACDTQPNLPEEIYAQEPAAGEQVAPGSRFTMFFPRFEGYCGG
ncbi:MAG: protein kinase [Chloroflexota bacterium]